MPPWGKRNSEHSFRLRGLRPTLTDREFKECIRKIAESARSKIPWRGDTDENHLVHSLVVDCDGGACCATVSSSSASKSRRLQKAMYTYRDDKQRLYANRLYVKIGEAGGAEDPDQYVTLNMDTKFDQMTVLHNPETPNVDVVVVHGVNGNAMDTFAKQHNGRKFPNHPYIHWARDLLKKQEDFKNARIMTWDYASYLFTRKKRDEDPALWPDQMLDSIHTERASCQVKGRPIIFIGYSYGGLLIREAAIKLKSSHNPYDSIDIRKCGFVFLATPHLGSDSTISSPFFMYAATKLWFRGALHERLKTLNKFLDANNDQWWEMTDKEEIKPPLFCFSETDPTNVAPLIWRTIVKDTRAKFLYAEFRTLPGTDHHSVCQFPDPHDENWRKFVTGVREVLMDLSARSDASKAAQKRAPNFAGNAVQRRSGIVPFSRATTLGFCIIPALVCGKHRPALSYNYKTPQRGIGELLGYMLEHKGYQHDKKVYESAVCTTDASLQIRSVISEPVNQQSTRTVHPKLDLSPPICQSGQGSEQIGGDQDDTIKQGFSLYPQEEWEKVTVLSIDGGRTRGFVSLLILESLMNRIQSIEAELDKKEEMRLPSNEELPWLSRRSDPALSYRKLARQSSLKEAMPPLRSATFLISRDRRSTSSARSKTTYLPCHYFDYIVGSESGGVLAMMLGRLRMSVSDCFTNFSGIQLASYGAWDPLRITQRFQAQHRFRETVRMVAEFRPGLEPGEETSSSPIRDQPFCSDEDLCKTIVLSAKRTRNGAVIPRIFRSYDNLPPASNGHHASAYSGRADTMPLHLVAQATSALQSSFGGKHIHEEQYDETFVDGTQGMTNPTYDSINEIIAKEASDESVISTLVSIGSGRPQQTKDEYFKPHLPVRAPMKKEIVAAFDREDMHRAARGLLAGPGASNRYFRFNTTAGSPSRRLPKEPLRKNMTDPERRYPTRFDDEIREMLDDEKVAEELDRCARNLVTRRRQRAQHTERWRRFSTCSSFRCSQDLTHEETKYRTENEMAGHFLAQHTEWWDSQSKLERVDSLKSSRRSAAWLGGPERPSSPLTKAVERMPS